MPRYVYFTLLCLLFAVGQTTAQVSQVEFGKNRVQYHTDFSEWLQYESDNFVTYWYGEARNIGQAVVQFAEYDFAYIQRMLEHRMNEKVQLIVYTDITDLNQSNIGAEEVFTTRAGQTKIIGNKVFVHFNGDHNDLRRQIREGVASVYLETMLFGSNLQEVVQNLVLMNLPDWFKQGLVAYIGESWNTELDEQLRHLILDEDYPGFERLSLMYPRLIGHSLWQYISESYGEATVSNLLYLTRINRSVESGFLYVLGTPYDSVIREWELFFQNRYTNDTKSRQAPAGQLVAFKNKRQLPITDLTISPDGQRVVYVLNEIGRYKVYLQNVADGDRELIFKGGDRNPIQATDYNYPLISWSPAGNEISILYEKRDRPRLIRYDVATGKDVTEDLSTEYQRVYSMDYVNPGTLVFSGAVRGYSDIFLYFPATRQSQRITTDFYDDLDAAFVRVRDRPGILFASNRADTLLRPMKMDTILPLDRFDIFYYDLESEEKELVRVTHTPWADERKPMAGDTTHFSYLSNRSGIFNREAGYLEDYIHHYEQEIRLTDGEKIILHADSTLELLDSTLIDTSFTYPIWRERAVVHQVSNSLYHIDRQVSAPRVERFAEVLSTPTGDQIYLQPLELTRQAQPPLTQYRDAQLRLSGISYRADGTSDDSGVVPALPGSAAEAQNDIPENYLFQTRFKTDFDAGQPDDYTEPPATEQPEPTPTTTDPTPDRDYTFEAPIFMSPDTVPAPVPRQREDLSVLPMETPQKSSAREVYKFRPGRITSYRLRFRTDYVTTTFDNSPLFPGAEPYGAPGRNNNGIGVQSGFSTLDLLVKGNVKDLFEDHMFEGGVRVPTMLNGTEYFLTYSNKKKRLDKTFTIYRKNHRFEVESPAFVPWRREDNTVMGQFSVSYPLDVFRSLRGRVSLRRDRVQLLATDQFALENPPFTQQTAGLRLEYVFDNTLQRSLNILHGTRYKIFSGMYKNFDLSLSDGFSLDFQRGFTGVAGIDARHYQRLDRVSILAVRFAGEYSFGAQKILYYLGGTDNWLLPKTNQTIQPPADDYIFETLALNLRGFDRNIRNGNTYVLVNAELRVPVFQYISRRIRSPFFRNFQLVGFLDAGTAWAGKDPFSEENPLNTTTFPNTGGPVPVSVQVTFFRDPIVVGYGVGARATIFGYMLRADYGWGFETRRTQAPKLHISLGLDF